MREDNTLTPRVVEIGGIGALLAFVTDERKAQGMTEADYLRKAGVNLNHLQVVRHRNTDIRLGNAIALINALGFVVTVSRRSP